MKRDWFADFAWKTSEATGTLDELIRVQHKARNIFADLEHATDDELQLLEREFRRMHARAEERRAPKREPEPPDRH